MKTIKSIFLTILWIGVLTAILCHDVENAILLTLFIINENIEKLK